ncbi:MAG: helix-turn-helix transcriptional regulator [Chloroflexi bacterium]|nr:helix-turn-helix transcriptional regulator [Chloroflexota bacterium]
MLASGCYGGVAPPLRFYYPAQDQKADFQDRVRALLIEVRRRAGWSRERVADAAGVPVSVVEGIEAGRLGTVTLEQYVDLALACGHMPLDLALAPVEELREYTAERPHDPRTVTNLEAWRTRRALARALEAARQSERATKR